MAASRNSIDSSYKEQRAAQSKQLMAQRRRQEAEANPVIGIAHQCTPSKYPPYQVPANSVANTLLRYITNLQQNDCPARPRNWSTVLNHQDYRRDHSLVRYSDHIWNSLDCTHYVPVASLLGLQNQLSNGLPLPVLVSSLSRLGKDILAQTVWPKLSLSALLDTILVPGSARISVQDHQKSKLDTFTITESCKVVRNRFRLPIQNRGPAWNCLDVEDQLPGFKGPQPLKFGGNLLDWHFRTSNVSHRDPFDFSTLSGAKRLDQWLLVSEANSVSMAHVDVRFGTWVSCLAGKKTFWIRNPSVYDQDIWAQFDVNDDHRDFAEPWGRIDLTPGSVL